MTRTQKEILEDLIKDYDENKVSVLVGAGFSMNVSDSYMSWTGLLYDMYKDVYENEIETYYQNYLHINSGTLKPLGAEEEIKNEYIKKCLKTEDLLKLVSLFIKKQGYRECVESYIEKRTPYAEEKDGIIGLFCQGKEIAQLNEGDFSAHTKLMYCTKFQNIYTTNYDNLLEFTNDKFVNNAKINKALITDSVQLSNKIGIKSIIKIHGSLRKDQDAPFVFDNDHDICYIFSQEDYDTYMKKHEAFSYMMRIAMLSGKFCLLGFSGTDANYLAWVKWMKDIIVNSNDKSTKIYLVTIDNKNPSDAQKIFNKNHHIEVLNLYDDDILNVIGIDIDANTKTEDRIKSIPPRQVITKFLEYICSKQTLGSENDRINYVESVDSGHTTSHTNNDPDSPTSKIGDSGKMSYKQLWLEAYTQISKNESISDVLEHIIEAKKDNRLPLIVYPQDNLIHKVVDKKDFCADTAKLFAIAVQDFGYIPSFFPKSVTQNEHLQNDSLWSLLVHRSNTIHGLSDKIEGEENGIKYENIVRNLFNLDFSNAKQTSLAWQANDYWIQHSVMLKALFLGSESSIKPLDEFIIDKKNSRKERLYAMNIANHIAISFPFRYNCDGLYNLGIDGLGDIQASIIKAIRGKASKPQTMGWIGSSHKIGSYNAEIVNSVRLIQFLLNSGLSPCFYGTYFLAVEDWYLVAHNLLRYYPYPCYYYSCQYSDSEVLRRIGQEYAYYKDLQKENEDLLIKSLKAVSNIDTPNLFKKGLLLISGRIYRAVDENQWYELFVHNIFEPLLSEISNSDCRNEFVENLRLGVGALKNSNNVQNVLNRLLSHFDDNPNLVCSIIRDNVQISNISSEWQTDTINVLVNLTQDSKSDSLFDLLYHISGEKELPKTALDAISTRILHTSDENLPKSPTVLTYMLFLTHSNNDLQTRIKSKIASKNIWHCGLMEDGKSFTDPKYIRLNLLDGSIEWSDEEFSLIAQNLNQNIQRLRESPIGSHVDSFMRTDRFQYLLDVKDYIEKLPDSRKHVLLDTYSYVSNILSDENNGYDVEKELLSEQTADISNAIKQIEYIIKSRGLHENLNEFNLILDRAILLQTPALKTNLGAIQRIVARYKEEIHSQSLDSKILKLLHIYRVVDLYERQIDVYWAFNQLYEIASIMRHFHKDNEDVNYWLTDTWVLRFVHTKQILE